MARAGEVVDCDAVGDDFWEVGEVEAESLGDFAGVFTNALPEREGFLAEAAVFGEVRCHICCCFGGCESGGKEWWELLVVEEKESMTMRGIR